MIAKDTVVAKLQCHDLDEPPDAIHYAPSLGPIGSGQLFEQAPTAGNFIQVVKELDYEDPDIVPAGHIYEMTISVFDDLHPSHTGVKCENGTLFTQQCRLEMARSSITYFTWFPVSVTTPFSNSDAFTQTLSTKL
ncbi:hypothetical protein R6Z07F_016183 [Ovis aries]